MRIQLRREDFHTGVVTKATLDATSDQDLRASLRAMAIFSLAEYDIDLMRVVGEELSVDTLTLAHLQEETAYRPLSRHIHITENAFQALGFRPFNASEKY